MYLSKSGIYENENELKYRLWFLNHVLNKKEIRTKEKKTCQCKLLNDNKCTIVIHDVQSKENDEFVGTEALLDLQIANSNLMWA